MNNICVDESVHGLMIYFLLFTACRGRMTLESIWAVPFRRIPGDWTPIVIMAINHSLLDLHAYTNTHSNLLCTMRTRTRRFSGYWCFRTMVLFGPTLFVCVCVCVYVWCSVQPVWSWSWPQKTGCGLCTWPGRFHRTTLPQYLGENINTREHTDKTKKKGLYKHKQTLEVHVCNVVVCVPVSSL